MTAYTPHNYFDGCNCNDCVANRCIEMKEQNHLELNLWHVALIAIETLLVIGIIGIYLVG